MKIKADLVITESQQISQHQIHSRVSLSAVARQSLALLERGIIHLIRAENEAYCRHSQAYSFLKIYDKQTQMFVENIIAELGNKQLLG